MLSNGEASVRSICCLVVLCAAVFSLALSGHAQSIDDTYKQALKEGGTLNVYGTLTPDTAVKVLPVFEKRFPGIRRSTPARAPIRSWRGRSPKRGEAEPSATCFT